MDPDRFYRSGEKIPRNSKHEIRNIKQIRNPNSKCSKRGIFHKETMSPHEQRYEKEDMPINFLFWSLKFKTFEFVSDFGFRHSDFNRKRFQTPPSRALPEASRSAGGEALKSVATRGCSYKLALMLVGATSWSRPQSSFIPALETVS